TEINTANARKESNKNEKTRGYVTAEQDQSEQAQHVNKISTKYVNYIKKVNPNYANNVSYQRGVSLNLLAKNKGKIERVQFSNTDPDQTNSVLAARSEAMRSMGLGSSVLPTTTTKDNGSLWRQH